MVTLTIKHIETSVKHVTMNIKGTTSRKQVQG